MKKDLKKITNQYFDKNDKLILALSGGPDSVFLGQILSELGFKNIITAHFNHSLRGIDSNKDEKFCEEVSKKWQFKFVSEKWNKPNISEEKCRNARYKFLEDVRIKNKAKIILLAHHRDDNTETIFFNFLRGTGVKGIKGLRIFDEDRKTFRPLLNVTKKEILDYLKNNEIKYREDKTNKENNYSRNYLRNKIFPALRKKFPDFEKSIIRSANIFKDLNDYIDQKTVKWISLQKANVSGFAKDSFLDLPNTMQSEIIRKIWKPVNLDFEQINNILSFIDSASSGKKIIIKKKTLKIFGKMFFIE